MVETALLDVDRDLVAVAHERDRTTDCRLRSNVANHQTVRSPAETTVGDERDVFAEPRTHDCAGDAEHLSHSRSALRPFVANHHDVSGTNLSVLDGLHRVFFAVEDAGRAAMVQPFVSRNLHDRSLR